MDSLSLFGSRGGQRFIAPHAVAFALLLALPAVAIAADCITPASGVAHPVALRAAPTSTSATKGTLASGQTLPLIALVPNWYEVRLASGATAYASKRSTDLETCPAAPNGSAGTGTTPTGAGGGATYELHAIDVGTGLSLLIRGPDFAVLYDAGSNDDTARGDANRTIAYLKTLSPA